MAAMTRMMTIPCDFHLFFLQIFRDDEPAAVHAGARGARRCPGRARPPGRPSRWCRGSAPRRCPRTSRRPRARLADAGIEVAVGPAAGAPPRRRLRCQPATAPPPTSAAATSCAPARRRHGRERPGRQADGQHQQVEGARSAVSTATACPPAATRGCGVSHRSPLWPRIVGEIVRRVAGPRLPNLPTLRASFAFFALDRPLMKFPLPDRHHRRGLPLGEHLRPGHPRAGGGDRGRGLRGAGRHQLRRPVAVRAAAKPRQRLHPVDRRRGVHARAGPRPGGAEPAQVHRGGPAQERRRADLPVRRDQDLAAPAQRHPARAARLHPHVRGHAGVRGAPHHPRGQELPGGHPAAVLQGAARLRGGRLLLLALPGPLRRRGLPEEPGRPDVPPVLRREHAARRRLQRGGRTRPAAGPHRPGGGQRAQRGAHLQRRPLLLRHQRHQHLQQDGVAPRRWRRATWWWWTATATSRSCTRSS